MRTAMLRSARVAGAGALVASFFLASASPAAAHDKVDAHGTISVTPAGDVTATPTVSGVFKGTEVLGLKTENISSISLVLAPVGPTGGEPVTVNGCDVATQGACGGDSVTYSWNPPAPAFNGPYEAQATAVHCTIVCVTPSTARVTPAAFRLGVVPRPPAEVQVAKGADRSVVVSWARNPEPDMLFYAVFRKMPGAADFTRVGGDIRQPASGRVTFTDTSTGDGGDIAYKVLAVRKGVTGDDKSTKTSGASAERSVTVDAPIPTTLAPNVPGQPGVTALPPPAVPAGAGVSISGFLGSQPAAKPAPGPKYLDLPDTGFGGTLPFDTPPAEELEEGPLEAELPSLANEEIDSSDEVSLTRPLVPVAAGAILLVLAAHMRLLSRKLKEEPAGVRPAAMASSPGALHAEQSDWSDENAYVDDEPYLVGEAYAEGAYADGAYADDDAYVEDAYVDGDAYADDLSASPEADVDGYRSELEWAEFEPPAIVDSSAGGGSLMAPESIGHYTEAAAPYYEGVPSSESPSEADSPPAAEGSGSGRRSTAVWRGPDYADDGLFDFDDLDASPEPVTTPAPAPPAQVPQVTGAAAGDAQLVGSFGFEENVSAIDEPSAPEAPVPASAATSPVPDDDDVWEEEMIWEVVSPSR